MFNNISVYVLVLCVCVSARVYYDMYGCVYICIIACVLRCMCVCMNINYVRVYVCVRGVYMCAGVYPYIRILVFV